MKTDQKVSRSANGWQDAKGARRLALVYGGIAVPFLAAAWWMFRIEQGLPAHLRTPSILFTVVGSIHAAIALLYAARLSVLRRRVKTE